MNTAGRSNRHANRLAGETSPYLLQHAHNPVDWYAWGSEALERAAREDKPILLSIGYAACHWCHVMERESFENDAIAALMNEHFVCIKVDREERPDLDDIYMAATVLLSGSGGWPMTVFLAPDQRPFFAGTYFPPDDRYGRPGFPRLLERIARLWNDQRAALLEQAGEITGYLTARAAPNTPAPVSEVAISKAFEDALSTFDDVWGGFGSAPKFPPSSLLSLLLRYHRLTSDERALHMVRRTLDGMKNGGLYDQLAGGFARYSTDDRWLVPHFEKMLYDNAQLARVYLEAYQATRDPEYERVARETLDYVAREMQSPDGGYYSATDADSEGEEGKYFVWTHDEVVEVLGPTLAERFALYYDVTPEGNFEGKSVLNTPRSPLEVAHQLGIPVLALEDSLSEARALLLDRRKERVPPLLDDKVLSAWNGLMLGTMAEGHRVLGDPRYLDSAERAARYLIATLRDPDGRLLRTARAGRAHLPAYLEDYAYTAFAFIDLYEAGGGSEWLLQAKNFGEILLRDFKDPVSGAFYSTSSHHESLILRPLEGHDGALPNPNAIAAHALQRLSHQLDRSDFAEAARSALAAYASAIERAPRAFATSLAALDFMLEPPLELVLAGKHPDEPGYAALKAMIGERYLPNRVLGLLDASQTGSGELPLVADKGAPPEQATLFLCRNFRCDAPVSDLSAARALVRERSTEALLERRSQIG